MIKFRISSKVNNIDRVIAIGETISKFKDFHALFYKTTAEFIADIAQPDFIITILIKGARAFQFEEEIVYLLKRNT
jgi:hypothetical protein